MLVDAATLYFRAYYALPDTLVDASGRANNAIRGFFDGLRVLRDRYAPEHIIACWDEDWRPQWRVDLVPSYKTHRLATEGAEEVPDTLSPQIPAIAELCSALGVPVLGAPNLEADDVVAALAFATTEPVIIVSGDRDLTQLVDDASQRRFAYLGTGVGTHTLYDESLVHATYGVRADQYVDFATLRGDPSDGIPGAPGIGAKTAAQYLAAFGDLNTTLDAAQHATPPLTQKKAATLREHADALRAMQRVITLRPTPLRAPVSEPNPLTAATIAAEWGVTSLIARW